MAIYELLGGTAGPGGTVQLICRKCVAAAQDATSESTILKVCSNCGMPLGEWSSVAERDAELITFAAEVKRKLAQGK